MNLKKVLNYSLTLLKNRYFIKVRTCPVDMLYKNVTIYHDQSMVNYLFTHCVKKQVFTIK